ncbi:MAG: serine hydrolase, partial [Flavobacteriales bacterium]
YDDPARYTNGHADVLKLLVELKEPVLFPPGDQWRYSNTGYNLLGTIVARASGMPFAGYLKQHIFDPAGMDRTVLYDYVPGRDPKMPDRAYGFQLAWNGRDASPNDSHFLNRGAGEDGVYTTVGDLLKWDRILHTDKLVSRATLDEAFTPGVLNNGDTTVYGFGWYIERSPSGQRAVQHSGGWLGFTTYLYRAIDEDRCVLLLTNNSTRYFWDIARGLTNILYDQPYSLPPLSAAEVLGRDVYDHGAEQAITGFQRSHAARPKDYRVVEDELNLLGYQLLWADRSADAAAILKLTLEEFPRSANAHDSYGDALLALGDTTGAQKTFEQAIALDPSLTATQEKIDGIVKARGK